MQPTREVIITNLVFMAFWVILVISIYFFGMRFERTRAFRGRMIAQWKPALAITALYAICYVLGRGRVSFLTPAFFCEALIGLTLARGIANYEPLKTTESIIRRDRALRNVAVFMVVSIAAGVVALLIAGFGTSIAQSIFHEVNRTQEAAQSFTVGKAQAFFLFLSDPGIAEETPYRLVALPLLWVLTGRRGLAVLVSALLFGAYHLSPLNGMYLQWWQFPISQFTASALIGLLWGWLFIKRGYESSVLAHTLSDWITVLLFVR